LKVDLEEFIAFLKTKLRPIIPIDVISKESAFAPFWYEYVTFISSRVEGLDPNIADMHNVLLYHIPSVAIVPRKDVFIVFIKKEEFDDIFLAYNSAIVSMNIGKYLYVVPYIDDKVVDVLVRNKINPAVLNEALYILPILTSIPCTNLVKDVPFIKEFLTIRMQSYIMSDDVAITILGYVLLKLLSLSKNTPAFYENTFNEIKNIIFKVLEKRKIYVGEHRISTTFIDFPVEIIVIKILPPS